MVFSGIVSNPDYTVPAITAGAKIVAALIVGFGAAILRHRWDAVDDTRRWARERNERRREVLVDALAAYVAARGAAEDAVSVIPARPLTQHDLDVAARSVYVVMREVHRLQALIGEPDFSVVAEDVRRFNEWWADQLEEIKGKQSTGVASPSLIEIHKLVVRIRDAPDP